MNKRENNRPFAGYKADETWVLTIAENFICDF